MRRPAPALPVSPKMLKHFAGATVVITAVLAMFAGGEDASVAAQVGATQAKNDMVAAEQQKLGTKQIATHLKVRSQGGFGEDGSSDTGGGGGGGGRGGAARPGRPMIQAQGPAFLPPANLAARPGGSLSRNRPSKPRNPGDPGDTTTSGGPGDAGNGGDHFPDAGNLSAAIEASRMRSGSGQSSGD
jgi:hypothetical protein